MRPPPPGPPWDLPISEAPLAFVDLEMTGLDVAHDRIVEVCVERWVGRERVASLATLVDPGERIGGAAHVHGIGALEVAGRRRFAAIAGEVLATLGGAILVAHAAAWDVGFLAAECVRAGLTLEVEHWLDTLILSRRALRSRRTPSTRCAESSSSTAAARTVPKATSMRCASCSIALSRCSRPRLRATSGRCGLARDKPARPSFWPARRPLSTVCRFP